MSPWFLLLGAACSDYAFHSPDACDAIPEAAASVPVDPTCNTPGGPGAAPWDVAIKWQWTGLARDPSLDQVLVLPAIGELDDDNGDGIVDGEDVPDIVFTATSTDDHDSALVVLNGATGAERLDVPHVWGAVALADVDVDGVTDIVAQVAVPVEAYGEPGISWRTAAFDAGGVLIWQSEVQSGNAENPQIAVADVDGDGRPEVISDTLVLDGGTGALLRQWANEVYARTPSVADIDLDGVQEVLLGGVVTDPTTGAVEWAVPTSDTGFSAIVQADADPEAEVVMVGQGTFGVYEHDGTPRFEGAGPFRPGSVCAADFDGDTEVEVAVPSVSVLAVYELDGSVLWDEIVQESTGLAGCSAYDVDGDGAYEVLYADEQSFRIFDGRTGDVRYQWTDHCSGTAIEYPTVADVDRDGSAEIVVASADGVCDGTGFSGITVLGQRDAQWGPAGPTWNTHDYAVTNVLPDGSVSAAPSWQVHNVYRGRPTADQGSLDLYATVTDVCATSCDPTSPVSIAVQVSNRGAIPVQAVDVTLYGTDADGSHRPVLTLPIGAVDGGTAAAGAVFEVTRGESGPGGFVVSVDDDGAGVGVHAECDEDNGAPVLLAACP
jgi:hypothetical protein